MKKNNVVESKIREIVYNVGDLGKKTLITDTIGMGQKIVIQENVICDWKLKVVIEGIYTIRFKFHVPQHGDNFSKRYSHYQVQKDANGTAILVRVSE